MMYNSNYLPTLLFFQITIILLFVLILFLTILIVYYRYQSYKCRRKNHNKKGPLRNTAKAVAFFHPYCSSGGGGERVLWKMIQVLNTLAVQQQQPITIIIYTIDDENPTTTTTNNQYKENLLRHVMERFDVQFGFESSSSNNNNNNNNNQSTTSTTSTTTATSSDSTTNNECSIQLHFVHLSEYKYLLQPATSFSLFMESIGSMRLAHIALKKSMKEESVYFPDIFIDTMGCCFTYLPAYLLFHCEVMAYVHYPTISTDMLQLVWERRRSYNHDRTISQSIIKTYSKLIYYILFAICYGIIGSFCCSIVLVNSTWTFNHIKSLWIGAKRRIQIIYPPCNVKGLLKEEDVEEINNNQDKQQQQQQQRQQQEQRIPAIVSIGQFRPEKDHILQLETFAKLREFYLKDENEKEESQSLTTTTKTTTTTTCTKWENIQFILIGSCRGSDDEKRLQSLKELSITLGISKNVQFIVNQPYSIIQQWLSKGTIGIHTMWNEHFGIGIVEMMAAGLITIAHNSGGPKLDIIQHNVTGFLATTSTEYAQYIYHILSKMTNVEMNTIRCAAQVSSKRFSDEVFASSFQKVLLNDISIFGTNNAINNNSKKNSNHKKENKNKLA